MKPEGCELKKMTDECYGAHHGQTDCHLLALNHNHDIIGYIDYSIYNNEIYINMVKTREQCRRQGIATGLMKKIEKIYPKNKINIGYSSGDGTRFFKAYKKQRTKNINEKIKQMKQENPERYKDYMKARKQVIPWSVYRRKWAR